VKRIAAALGAVLVLVAVQVITLQAWELFARPLWLDEIHTLLVATRHGTVQSLRDLSRGADFNPPTLFLLYRLVSIPFGGLSEVGMRMVSVASVAGALAVTHCILRTRFGSIESAAGTLAVWAHPVVVGAAFEARYYGPFLLFAACFVLLLARAGTVPASRSAPERIGLGVTAVLLCTIHYFGVLVWFVAMAQVAITERRSFHQRWRRYVPAIAGPVALAACVPMYLGQRQVLSVPTWMPDPAVGDLVFLVAYFFATPALILAGLMLAARRARSSPEARMADQPSVNAASQVGAPLLLAQAIVPLALATFSLLVQPATQPRYWITGVLAIGAAVAYAAARVGRPSALVLAGLGVVVSWLLVKDESAAALRYANSVHADLATVTSQADSAVALVIRRRHSLYPLIVSRPLLSDRLMLLGPAEASDTSDGTLLAARRFAVVEWDVAKAHRRIYGIPMLIERAALERQPSFYLLEPSDSLLPTASEFPGRSIERVAPRLFRLTVAER
jgi:hypothetical protein